MLNCVLWHFTTGLDVTVVLEGAVNSFCCVMARDEEGNAVLTLSSPYLLSLWLPVEGGFVEIFH